MEQLSRPRGVSAREADVLAAVLNHLTNAEIAAQLFISIRTVESHVSSLLRKFEVADRRGLIAAAAREHPPAAETRSASWPAPLTPFIGRAVERTALVAALRQHRLVTAVGPGGVGKTRLTLAVADDVGAEFDGACFVDLVPVTDDAMVVPAVAAALGLSEQRGRSALDTILADLAGRRTLLFLDNCEHVKDGVVVFLERLLAASPTVTVLATSRARLLVPYEQVFLVPGLSAADDGDAVALFLARAAAAGAPPDQLDHARVAAICRGLDGLALAIELAAARLPVLGLDGLEAGLADRLHLLAGGRRIDDRHRSLRSALDWSYLLVDPGDRAVLRRVSVFASPFTVEDAGQVVGAWPPATRHDVAAQLAALADDSLLVPVARPDGMYYRALETIRQYASERLDDHDEREEAHARHVRWCLVQGRRLLAEAGVSGWAAQFDRRADELRAALGWATSHAPADAYALALLLAELSFHRGRPGEAQRRYEHAAGLASDWADRVAALHLAAGAAVTRHFGDEALRLHRAAAAAALATGDRAAAARDLAYVVELAYRGPGLIAHLPEPGELNDLLRRAADLAADDPGAQARVGAAEAHREPEVGPDTAARCGQAIALARRAGDPLTECSVLDKLMTVQLAAGDINGALSSAERRCELLATLPVGAASGLELFDGYGMAADFAVCAGRLPAALTFAQRLHDLPFYREEAHLATARLLVVTLMSGAWDQTVASAERFRTSWERAGRPTDGDLNRGAYAAATGYGLRGDDATRAAWLGLIDDLVVSDLALRDRTCYQALDALLFLHRGQPERAMARLDVAPEDMQGWHDGLWRPWYAAFWAEAAVLAGRADGAERVERARPACAGNPIAETILERAAGLLGSDRPRLPALAERFRALGCEYQLARTRQLAG